MNKLLMSEIVVLLALLAVSVMIRVGVLDASAQAGDEPLVQETTVPVETEPPETEPPATEPEPVVLTFGDDFTLESGHYFVYDCANETMMAVSGTETDKIYPASVTKLFSAYVALQYLNPKLSVMVGNEVNLVASDSSLAYIRQGQKITVEKLVEGMMLLSGNDAAYALAAATARAVTGNSSMSAKDAVAYFVDMMNQAAEEYYLTGSHFMNPDGYQDLNHYTCAADLVTIARLALSNETIAQYVGSHSVTLDFYGTETTWNNTNALLNPASQYYREEAVGLKTGSTSYAGFCLLSAFEYDGDYIIIGAFGCVRPEDRYIDTLKLYDLVLETFAENTVEEIP